MKSPLISNAFFFYINENDEFLPASVNIFNVLNVAYSYHFICNIVYLTRVSFNKRENCVLTLTQ